MGLSLIVRGILTGASGLLWRMGGSSTYPKIVRRLGCALLIAVGAILSRNWWGLISIPMFYGVFTMGYGVNSPLMRWLKNGYQVRYICGILYCLPGGILMWGNWCLFGYYILIVPLGVMLAGNQRFKFEDEREEFIIGMLVCSMPILA